jgi:hypothetical protein
MSMGMIGLILFLELMNPLISIGLLEKRLGLLFGILRI